jgi:glucokinase
MRKAIRLLPKSGLTSIKKLAASIASFINILSPELIIIGGGISKADELLLKPLNEYRRAIRMASRGETNPGSARAIF